MAARRISKTAIDWAAFADRVPANQKDLYRSFKAKSESYINRIHQNPESLPKIDFSFYKGRLGNMPMIDQFDKAYQAVEVKYPQDKTNLVKAIESEKTTAEVEAKQYIAGLQKSVADAKALIDRLDKLPPPEEMTREMYAYYFPDIALDPVNRPTFWPHTANVQPGHKDAHLIK